VAGLLVTADDGRLPRGCLVVCTVTGHGLKDPGTALDGLLEIEPLAVDPQAVAHALELV
jgi:threonine synthase